MKKNTALDLFLETALRHLYEGEKAVAKNLKTLADKAATSKLTELFNHHYEETEQQILRIERIFEILNIDPKESKIRGLETMQEKTKELLKTLIDMNFTDHSKGINGILNEGQELIRHFAKTDANDCALVSAGQKVEHYEIACYNFLCLLVERYQMPQVLELLRASLAEEVEMEKKLSAYAPRAIPQMV